MSNSEAIMRTANSHNSALKILVCYHKPYTIPPNDDGILLPIQVGKALTDIDLHMQADNELNGQPCDNISSKNAVYCEPTAMYWAWKNLKKLYPDVKYVGLCHYRRFFAFDEQKFFAPVISKLEEDIANYRPDPEKIIKILESGRFIFTKKYVFPYSVAAHYCMSYVNDNYRVVKRIIEEKFPDYYEAFQDVMERNNKLSAYNMFIMKWEDFEKFCEWFFAVLAEAEQSYQINPTPYQRRLFMTERLFNVYVYKHKMKAKYLNIYYYGDSTEPKNLLKRFLSCINRFFIVSKCNLAMFILNVSFRPFRKLFKKSPKKP